MGDSLDEILTHSLKRAYFNGSTDVKARESGVIPNDTKLGEVMVQVLVAEAKAAIQKLVKEVIGLHDGQQLAPRTMKPYKNQRNRDAKVRDSLRVEQRQRAKERGLL